MGCAGVNVAHFLNGSLLTVPEKPYSYSVLSFFLIVCAAGVFCFIVQDRPRDHHMFVVWILPMSRHYKSRMKRQFLLPDDASPTSKSRFGEKGRWEKKRFYRL